MISAYGVISCFTSVPPEECREKILKYATTTDCLQINYNRSLINSTLTYDAQMFTLTCHRAQQVYRIESSVCRDILREMIQGRDEMDTI
jgi:nucleoid-associated protein YejK